MNKLHFLNPISTNSNRDSISPFSVLLSPGTRRYGPLRGSTFSSYGGLWPSAKAVFKLQAKKVSSYAFFTLFRQSYVFSSALKNQFFTKLAYKLQCPFLVCCLSPPSVTGSKIAGNFWSKSVLLKLKKYESLFFGRFRFFSFFLSW